MYPINSIRCPKSYSMCWVIYCWTLYVRIVDVSNIYLNSNMVDNYVITVVKWRELWPLRLLFCDYLKVDTGYIFQLVIDLIY